MQHFSIADAHGERLKLTIEIEDLVIDRRSAGEALTWRVMFEIQEQAISELRKQRNFDPETVEFLVRICRYLVYLKTDGPVNFGKSNIRSISASMTTSFYGQVIDGDELTENNRSRVH